jgi:hypothetical protein
MTTNKPPIKRAADPGEMTGPARQGSTVPEPGVDIIDGLRATDASSHDEE